MTKIQINSISHGYRVDVDDCFFNYLKNNVRRSYVRDGIVNFSLSRLNFALRKINKRFNMDSCLFESLDFKCENFL